MTTFLLPSADDLEQLLAGPFSRRFPVSGVTVLQRTPLGQGSFPKEVVRLSAGDVELEVFCKYEGGFDHSAFGHRGGVDYEARVYEKILGPAGYSAPEMLLVHRPPGRKDTWLFLEYLPAAVRVSKATEDRAMPEVAAWIGRLHERTAGADLPGFLTRYDRDYYLSWAERSDATVRGEGRVGDWWRKALRCFCDALPLLEEAEQSLLHGEYYPKNVLWSPDRVSPVDWESAAVGAGVVDLVSLVDGWSEAVRGRCAEAYVRSRWSSGPPGWFDEVRALAEVYVNLRWLPDPDDSGRVSHDPRVQRIGELAEGLGWV